MRTILFLFSVFYSCIILGTVVVGQECLEGAECMATTKDSQLHEEEKCVDLHKECLNWASSGKCDDEEFYRDTCPKSCRKCWACDDENESCKGWADAGECIENPQYMLVYCAKSCNICHYKGGLRELMLERKEQAAKTKEEADAITKTKYGVEQTVPEGDEKTRQTYDAMVTYMEEHIMVESEFMNVRNECKNRSPNCVFWAGMGECIKTRDYMVVQCAPACNSCEMLLFENRCPYDKNAPTVLQHPGDLDTMFEKLLTFKEYTPVVLSRPNATSPEVYNGPWVVEMISFLTEEESNTLIQLGAGEGYAQSADVGKRKFDGTFDKKVNTGRTSTNAWCQNECESNPVTRAVTERMMMVTGIPHQNFEFLQMLQYEVGQFYQQHHDYIGFHNERAQGVRILTIYLYLNEPEAGGGTNFPKLNNITVMPKIGKALIWPSVLNENPNKKDPRTDHQALPVEKGFKFGANAWIHQRDFKEPFSRSCI
mmetsp:Transcript_19394/g.22169  ORF Transcript_19394/g.22169 Transcript_19394/m.22169 type:complete len:483 (+) Transcript_19394:58-1506(+)